MWRVTITNTMPVAMIATETVWIVRLKMLRGVRNRPSVIRLNTRHSTTKAPIMPSRRVSISSVEKAASSAGARRSQVGASVMASSRMRSRAAPPPRRRPDPKAARVQVLSCRARGRP
jgi:hypothetical protein